MEDSKSLVLRGVKNKPNNYLLIELIMIIEVDGTFVNVYGPSNSLSNSKPLASSEVAATVSKSGSMEDSSFFK